MCSSNLGFTVDTTNLGFSVGYVLFSTFVPGISRQTTVWYQVRTYNIGLHPTSQKKVYARARKLFVRVIFVLLRKTLIYVRTSYQHVCTWYQPADHSMVPGTYVQYRATSKKKKTPGTSERFVANCGVGPSTLGQGDSTSLVKPTQDQRR